jgi:hypothetical protein
MKTERSASRDIRSPHSKNLSSAKDREERFEGHKKPHSKNLSGAEDREECFNGHKKPTLEEYEWF